MTIDIQNESISATQLARNVSKTIDQVRLTGRKLCITKGSQTVAVLAPPTKSGFPISQLAQMLSSLPKLGDDADKMIDDIIKSRENAILPGNSWES